ncbi:MAG TPA: putative toxin-antitoxin system toxin component, PIN family [Tepidisphaeraceae bacterium]|jgi:putative PIN family toxin of toxin-antitoxin system
MTTGNRVVFDCNTFLQALGSPNGPAGQCVQLAIDGRINLFVSPSVLEELRDVTGRPKVIEKLHLVAARVEGLFEAIEIAATLLDGFPEVFTYPRDPDDAHYINLALAADAKLIVSRDKDLLDLMDSTKPEAVEFQKRFPSLRILDPVGFLHEVSA